MERLATWRRETELPNVMSQQQQQDPSSTSPACSPTSSLIGSSDAPPTPLPKRVFFPLIMTLTMESIAYTAPMPFVANLVAHLQSSKVEESGKLSGFIVGSFYLGTVLSGSVWGRLSDKFGRRGVIVFGLIAQAILELLFGMSPWIWLCFFARMVHGGLNGSMATVKSVIAESTDATNENVGFSLMTMAWSGGVFIGMAMGGTYGMYQPEIAGYTFPAFMPCFLQAMFALLCAAANHFILPETNPTATPMTWSALKDFIVSSYSGWYFFGGSGGGGSGILSAASGSISSSSVLTKSKDDDEKTPDIVGSNGNAVLNVHQRQQQSPVGSADDVTFYKMWSTIPAFKAAMIDYLLLSSHEIIFDECFGLIAVAPASVAGFSMSVGEVAMALSYSGLFMLFSVFAFPIARRWYGDFVYVYASCVLCFCYVAIPQMEIAAWNYHVHWFIPLAVLFPLRTWGNDFCYSQALIAVQRSAPSEVLGTVSSMSTTAAAVVRLIVPPIGSGIFAFSVTSLVWMYPLNSTLSFALCSVLALTGALHRRGEILKSGKM